MTATDEELLQIAAATIDPYESCGIAIGEYEAETECAVEVYGSELIAFARAVLTRWGRPAIKPVPQEVEELIQCLRSREHSLTQEGASLRDRGDGIYFGRAADMLTLLARPAIEPEPVSERLPGPEDCDEEGRCWWWCHHYESWQLDHAPAHYRHWLPHHALPVPTP